MTSLNLEFIYYQIYRLLTGEFFGFGNLYKIVSETSIAFAPYSVIISLLSIVGIVYCFRRLHHIEHEMIAQFAEVEAGGMVAEMPNKRWARIINHLNSDNESDWRLAILEADIILAEMLNSMGYQGDTIADKLRGIEKSDFNSINAAWEAHKIRNIVAHEGGDRRIDNRAARQVILLYEQVFREFRFI